MVIKTYADIVRDAHLLRAEYIKTVLRDFGSLITGNRKGTVPAPPVAETVREEKHDLPKAA